MTSTNNLTFLFYLYSCLSHGCNSYVTALKVLVLSVKLYPFYTTTQFCNYSLLICLDTKRRVILLYSINFIENSQGLSVYFRVTVQQEGRDLCNPMGHTRFPSIFCVTLYAVLAVVPIIKKD